MKIKMKTRYKNKFKNEYIKTSKNIKKINPTYFSFQGRNKMKKKKTN